MYGIWFYEIRESQHLFRNILGCIIRRKGGIIRRISGIIRRKGGTILKIGITTI